jgi:hypothetical protein
MSEKSLQQVADLAQREWLYKTQFQSVNQFWERYCEDFAPSECIARTPMSLNTLRNRAMKVQYYTDVMRAREYYMKRFPPLSMHETLLAYLRRIAGFKLEAFVLSKKMYLAVIERKKCFLATRA